MKDETGGIAIEEFIGLKPKMYSFLVDKLYIEKQNVNKNVVLAITHNNQKDVLLNDKYIRHSVNRIQIKDCMKLKKLHCLVLMTKFIFKTMDTMD